MDSPGKVLLRYSGNQHLVAANRLVLDFLDGDLASAVFLHQVVFWDDQSKKMGRDGWFYKTHETWYQEIGLKAGAIRRVTKRLVEKGYLRTWVKKVNGAPTLHYQFLEDRFFECFDPFVSQYTTPNSGQMQCAEVVETEPTTSAHWNLPLPHIPISKTVVTYSSKKQTHEASAPQPASGESSSSPKPKTKKKTPPKKSFHQNGFDLEGNGKNHQPTRLEVAIRKLHSALMKNRRIKRAASVGKWMKDIRQLVTREEAPIDEIVGLVDWYCDHMEDEFVPQVFSAKSFCDKYYQLIRASKRKAKEFGDERTMDEKVRDALEAGKRFENG